MGTFVTQVSATDLDLGQHGEVRKWGPSSPLMKDGITSA